MLNGKRVIEGNGYHVELPSETGVSMNDQAIDEETKAEMVRHHFRQIMLILGLALTNDSLKDTPQRVANMYVKATFSGLNPKNKPGSTLFENSCHYNEMLVEKASTLYSCCEHHFVPTIGKAHVAYFSSGKLIGLSKLNRIVQYSSRRPQVQERLTEEIAKALKAFLHTKDVAVVIDATHLFVASRGVNDVNSTTITSH